MKHLLSLAAFCAAFLLAIACNTPTAEKPAAPAAFDLTTAKKEIEEANRQFMDLVAMGDSVGLANSYTKDAKFMKERRRPVETVPGYFQLQPACANLQLISLKLNIS